MGCSRKNPHPPDGWDSGNSRRRGGQRLWKSRQEGGGLNWKKKHMGHFVKKRSLKNLVHFQVFGCIRIWPYIRRSAFELFVWTEAMMRWNLWQFYYFWLQNHCFIPANSHALGVSLTPASRKLPSHAKSRLPINFSRLTVLTRKYELLQPYLTKTWQIYNM